jgi:hypothetical protein
LWGALRTRAATLYAQLDGSERAPRGVPVAAPSDFAGKIVARDRSRRRRPMPIKPGAARGPDDGAGAAEAVTRQVSHRSRQVRRPRACALRLERRRRRPRTSAATAPAAYPIFAQLDGRGLDFFIGLGDMIYADDICWESAVTATTRSPARCRPATSLRSGRIGDTTGDDAASQQALAQLPYYAVWDDHEIRDDAGPLDDDHPLAPGGHLLPTALRAFLDYQPIVPPQGQPTRLYRSLRWGRHLEIFLLDTRQYRGAFAAHDTEAHPKTMLGAEQLRLVRGRPWRRRTRRGRSSSPASRS